LYFGLFQSAQPAAAYSMACTIVVGTCVCMRARVCVCVCVCVRVCVCAYKLKMEHLAV
jgi:hypothetical protein